MLNKDRLVDEFIKLVKIDSETGEEKDVAEYCKNILEEMGFKVVFDKANDIVGGNCGNLIAYYGDTSTNEPIMLNCHMDTVKPGKGIKPIIDGNIIKTDGSTILGSDDKSGIVAILEALRNCKEENTPIRPLEIVFTIAEEGGVIGSKNLDYSLLKSKMGFAFDDHNVGEFTVSAPAKTVFEIEVTGKAAHAGVEPENGISAALIGAEALSKLTFGRISENTTANIGTIQSDGSVNVVRDKLYIKGEARSSVQANLNAWLKELDDVFNSTTSKYNVEKEGKTYKASYDIKLNHSYKAFKIDLNDDICEYSKLASEKAGFKPKFNEGLGGSDANHFNEHGIKVLMTGTGMKNVHTTEECINIEDMFNASKFVSSLISTI